MKCKNHPRYKAKRKPTVACLDCFKMFIEEENRKTQNNSYNELDDYKSAIKEIRNTLTTHWVY
jgi:hypothetical protein